MKYLLFIILLSGCSMLKKQPNLPSDARQNLYCVEQFLGEVSVEEAIAICKFINREKANEKN